MVFLSTERKKSSLPRVLCLVKKILQNWRNKLIVILTKTNQIYHQQNLTKIKVPRRNKLVTNEY